MSHTSRQEHRWAFPPDRQINTVLSVTPLTAPLTDVRNSRPLTNTEQDSLAELIASVIFKREENNHLRLIAAIIFFPYLLILSEEVKSSSPR